MKGVDGFDVHGEINVILSRNHNTKTQMKINAKWCFELKGNNNQYNFDFIHSDKGNRSLDKIVPQKCLG
jgi:hypothetical protein